MSNSQIVSKRFIELRESQKDEHGKPMPVIQLAHELLAQKFIVNYESDVIRQEIGKVERKGKFPQLFLIEGYCKYFKVTSDFLLGIRDTKVVDENIAMINKTTGLSDTSIQTLISCKTGGILADDDFPVIDLLNFILSDEVLFHDFLNYLGLYINNTYDTPCYRDPDKHIYVPVPDDNIRNTPFVKSKDEHYIAIGKKQKEKICGKDAYQTINLPVSLLESHAVRIIQNVIDKWKDKWKKEKR